MPTSASPFVTPRVFIGLVGAACILSIVLLSLSIFGPLRERKIHYLLQEPNEDVIEVLVEPRSSSHVRIKGVKNDFRAEVEAKELLSNYRLSEAVIREKPKLDLFIVFTGVATWVLFIVGLDCWSERKMRKLRKIMKSSP